MRMVTRLPPMGSPTKSRKRYPFFTIERAPQEGQHLIRSFACTCKIILLPLYSSQVHPFFLLSFWAKMLYVILIAILIWWMMRYWNNCTEKRRVLAMQAFETSKEQELYRSKIHFFTNVAHEIRTPLTLILGPVRKHTCRRTNTK